MPQAIGVYAFLDALGAVVYIGSTTNFHKRMGQHVVGRAMGYVKIRLCSTRAHARLLEAKLVGRLKPSGNSMLISATESVLRKYRKQLPIKYIADNDSIVDNSGPRKEMSTQVPRWLYDKFVD